MGVKISGVIPSVWGNTGDCRDLDAHLLTTSIITNVSRGFSFPLLAWFSAFYPYRWRDFEESGI
jgi:hypothetical protein